MTLNDHGKHRTVDEMVNQRIGNYDAFMEPRMNSGSQQERYQALNELMTGHLVGLTVFKFNEIQVRIYVMGVDPQGNIVGWKTSGIQT
jgi:hypothetical protein